MFNRNTSTKPKSPFSSLDRSNSGSEKGKRLEQSTLSSFFSSIPSSSNTKKRDLLGNPARTKSDNAIGLRDNKENSEMSRFFSTKSFSNAQLTTKLAKTNSFSNSNNDIDDLIEIKESEFQNNLKKPKNFKSQPSSNIYSAPTTMNQLNSSSSSFSSTSASPASFSSQKTVNSVKLPSRTSSLSSVLTGRPLSESQYSQSSQSSQQKKRQPPWATGGTTSARPVPTNPRLKQSQPKTEQPLSMVSGITLSSEQQKVLDLVVEKKDNVFYTGSAGTGKSHLLRIIIQKLRAKYPVEGSVAVTASTGLAATNIEGMTINRFAGIGLGTETTTKLINMVKRNKTTLDRWKSTKVLIIDEISMVDANLLSKLNYIAKSTRNSNLPFGGIQLILTGDFFQLPPVVKREDQAKYLHSSPFCFDTDCWRECIKHTILLNKVFRQQGDQSLINMLNALRMGEITNEVYEDMKKLQRKVIYEDGIMPTELYSTRYEVNRANMTRLNSLHGKTFTYKALDIGENEQTRKRLDSVMAVSKLEMKVGAQVLMIKNQDSLVVNGSIGKVVGILPGNLFDKMFMLFTSEELNAMDDFFELMTFHLVGSLNKEHEEIMDKKLAHIMQTATQRQIDFLLQAIQEQKERSFHFKQKYSSPSNNFSTVDMDTNSEIFPVVKFTVNSTAKYSVRRINPQEFFLENSDKDYRTQLPLLLSWALSIHKSQGQTLPRVKVDLMRVFEMGQVYVALSRAVSTECLEIANLRREAIKASDRVKEFYSKLQILD